MIKTHISVTFGMTHNLGDYSNVRPEVQMSAQLFENDDANNIARQLLDEACEICYDQIDATLERCDQPAKFSPDARYHTYVCVGERLAVIVASKRAKEFEAARKLYSLFKSGHRIQKACELLEKYLPDYRQMILIGDDDFDDVPILKRVTEIEFETCRVLDYSFDSGGKKFPHDLYRGALRHDAKGAVSLQHLFHRLPDDKEVLLFDGKPKAFDRIHENAELRGILERLDIDRQQTADEDEDKDDYFHVEDDEDE